MNESKQTLRYSGANSGGKDRIVSTNTYRDQKESAKSTHLTEVRRLAQIVRDWMATGSSSVFESKFRISDGQLYAIQLSRTVHVIMLMTKSDAGGNLYVFERFFTRYNDYERYLNSMRGA